MLLPGQHASPFCSGHAWQFAHRDASPSGTPVRIERDATSALAFTLAHRSGYDELAPLDGGSGACPLVGDHAVELLAYRLQTPGWVRRAVEISIHGVLPGSTMERKLVASFARRFEVEKATDAESRIASLEGGFDGYMSRRSAHLRKNLRRESRRAENSGIRFERVRPSTPSGARTQMKRMLLVEGGSWKVDSRANHAITHARALHAALLDRLSLTQDALIVYAKHGSTDVGFILGGVAAGTYAGLHFGFRKEWGGHSIGNLLQIEKIRWLCEHGLKQYDMGIAGSGLLAYKSRWAERVVPSGTVLLTRQ